MRPTAIHRPKASAGRGTLKIFLGAAPGVGKTYRMLSEAKDRLARGEDIVIGVVEPHGRPATAAMAEGLERVPTRSAAYRGTAFNELDTEAVLCRRPTTAVIDELAHANVPGSPNKKRWQDVAELLAAGVNVVTTLNVQHLESLGDMVENLTGVRVRETIPDAVFAGADDIELVDLSADELLARLGRGEVYSREKIPQALSRFFRKENLVALRELALRQMAEGVEAQWRGVVGAKQDKSLREHVVVCVTPTPRAPHLIRRAYRFARALQAVFDCLTVTTPGARMTKEEARHWETARKMATELGANAIRLEGDNPADEIARYMKSAGATLLVLGETAQNRFSEIVRGSFINRVSRQIRRADIVVIATEGGERNFFSEND